MTAAAVTLVSLLALLSCGKEGGENKPPEYGKKPQEQKDTASTSPGTDTTTVTPVDPASVADYSDMVLLYGYGHHRSPYSWGREYTDHYVFYTDRTGHTDWLFDAFLFLEFMDPPVSGGAGKTFITGYVWDDAYIRKSANQEDWDKLIKYYFVKDTAIDAIDKSVDEGARLMGKAPAYKRQIVIGIPEPIKTEDPFNEYSSNTYWGSVDGRQLNFSSPEDRITAVKWYIDRCREEFAKADFKNVELGGFYWVAEKSTHTADIIARIGDYLKGMNYSFNWIPYFHAEGYTRWKEFGFTYAFMQPNYFFNDTIPYERLVEACNDVIKNDMGLEVEFDGKVLVSWGYGYGGRLRDYMKAFKDYGAWEKSRLVYYQGSWAVKWLHDSSSAEDQELYYDFCDWVSTRPYRTKLNEQ